MEHIIELLKEKNHFLEKFSKLNDRELVRFNEGDFDGLDEFYTSRERLLKIVDQIDFMIEQQSTFVFKEDTTPGGKKEIAKEFDLKTDLVNKILAQDLQILSFIEQEKSTIIKELSTLKNNKKVIGSYKSGQKTNRVNEKV